MNLATKQNNLKHSKHLRETEEIWGRCVTLHYKTKELANIQSIFAKMKKYEEGVYTTVQLQTYFGCLPVWYYTQYLSAILDLSPNPLGFENSAWSPRRTTFGCSWSRHNLTRSCNFSKFTSKPYELVHPAIVIGSKTFETLDDIPNPLVDIPIIIKHVHLTFHEF